MLLEIVDFFGHRRGPCGFPLRAPRRQVLQGFEHVAFAAVAYLVQPRWDPSLRRRLIGGIQRVRHRPQRLAGMVKIQPAGGCGKTIGHDLPNPHAPRRPPHAPAPLCPSLAPMAHQPASHHDDQRPGVSPRRGRGQGRTGGQPGLGLPLGPFARRLHLPMDERVIHRHSPSSGHGRRRLKGRRRRREAPQSGRDLLMRPQSPPSRCPRRNRSSGSKANRSATGTRRRKATARR